MGIDLCRDYALMAEHFLHYAQVGTVLDEVGGKGVAEGVRGDFLLYSGGLRLLLDHIEDGDTAHGLSETAQEKNVVGR